MVSLTLATTFALAATLGTQSTFARPTATTNVVLKTSSGGSSAPVVWPFTGTAHAERKRNTEDSNASRLARGLPLKAPVKRHELDRRLTPAPSAGVGSDESFEFVTCSGGGSTSGTYTSVSGNTNQDLVNACAAYVVQFGRTSFYINSNGDCYANALSYNTQECTADNYAIYST